MNVVIIDYGAGNVASVKNTLSRLGINATLSNQKEEILSADKIIFPGVGEAAYAMQKLKEQNLVELIPELKQPLLGICLGMQLLCKSSEERDTKALGIFDVEVKKFTIPRTVPHMGWNDISTAVNDLEAFDKEYFYFAHSYFVPKNKNTMATCSYGSEFSAVIKKDNFWACQFHPEKSGVIGMNFLENFIKNS